MRFGTPIESLALIATLLKGIVIVALVTGSSAAAPSDRPDANELMRASVKRHERYPYVFERVDLITRDRGGHRSVRKARRYWRVEKDGGAHFLWVFEQPPELRGVAVLAQHHAHGEPHDEAAIYLPAQGEGLKQAAGEEDAGSMAAMNILGTDFSIEDLSPENTDAYRYRLLADISIGSVPYYQIEARPRDAAVAADAGFLVRRLLMRQETLMIERCEYFDQQGQLVKRLSRHNLKPYQGGAWRAGMSLMQNFADGHQTLIKVLERVDSEDYVPRDLFTAGALLSGRYLMSPRERALALSRLPVDEAAR